jgi:raffinose/stachyose/melibiose transport system substrate-binding protein
MLDGWRARLMSPVIVAICLGTVVSCGGDSAPETKPGSAAKKVTLRMIQNVSVKPAWAALIKKFEAAHPDIAVNVQYVDTAEASQLVLTQLASGNGPDVFGTTAGNGTPSSVIPLAQAGKLLDLSGAEWEANLAPQTESTVSYQGKLYSWIVSLNAQGAFYNKELFTKLGLTVPTKMSEVLAMCPKITAAGKVPFAQGFADVGTADGILWGLNRMIQYVYAADPGWDARRAKKAVTFADSPEWQRALQSFVSMKDAGCFQKGVQGASFEDQLRLFGTGDAVMTVGASSQLSSILAVNPDLDYAFMNLPPDDAGQAVAGLSATNAIAASATTKYPKQVKALFDFAAEDGNSREFAKLLGGIAPADADGGAPPDFMADMKPLFATSKIVLNPTVTWPNPSLVPAALAPGFQGLLTGQQKVKDVLEQMDRLWDNPKATS